jgi:uncharacterized protein Smg (DUF494 family)
MNKLQDLQSDYDTIHDALLQVQKQRRDLREALRTIAALTTNDEHSCYDTLALIQKVCGEILANT